MTRQLLPAEYKKLSDEELVHRFVHRGEQEVMSAIFERYGHLVLGVCRKYLKDTEAAKDAMQQVFIKLIDDLPRFEIKHFKGWLLQVTRNHCLMLLRKNMPEIHSDELIKHAVVESDESWHHKIEEEHLYRQLEAALELLKEQQRVCVQYFYLEKLTYAEISARTKYTLQEVKSFLQNGKRNLKIKMEALADERK